MELLLEQGQTVEVRTGFVLLEGSQREQQLHDGFLMWLEFSGAGGAGISVGNGFVKVAHSTEYAVADERCESYHAAANRLLKQKVGRFYDSPALLKPGGLVCSAVPQLHPPGVLAQLLRCGGVVYL